MRNNYRLSKIMGLSQKIAINICREDDKMVALKFNSHSFTDLPSSRQQITFETTPFTSDCFFVLINNLHFADPVSLDLHPVPIVVLA